MKNKKNKKLKYLKAYQRKLPVFLICWSTSQEIQKIEHSFYDSLESEPLLEKEGEEGGESHNYKTV